MRELKTSPYDPKTLQAFKKAHPKLAKYALDIEAHLIYEKSIDNRIIIYEPPISQITIRYPFIFDKRLIPKKFGDSEIVRFSKDDHLNPPPETGDLFNESEYFHPKYLIAYVKKNIKKIRKELKNPKLSEIEALDALCEEGNFCEHITWWSKLNRNTYVFD